MAKRKETEASKFLEKPSEDSKANEDLSESESKAGSADKKMLEPAKEKQAVKEETKVLEVPGKYRKFQ